MFTWCRIEIHSGSKVSIGNENPYEFIPERVIPEQVFLRYRSGMNLNPASSNTAFTLTLRMDLTQTGRERRRERYKTIHLIRKYNDFTWECNQLSTFPSSSFGFVNRTWKARFCGFQRTWATKHESFQSPCGFKIKVSNSLCSHSFASEIK